MFLFLFSKEFKLQTLSV